MQTLLKLLEGRQKNDKSNFYVYARAAEFETMSYIFYGVNVGYFPNDKSEMYQ